MMEFTPQTIFEIIMGGGILGTAIGYIISLLGWLPKLRAAKAAAAEWIDKADNYNTIGINIATEFGDILQQIKWILDTDKSNDPSWPELKAEFEDVIKLFHTDSHEDTEIAIDRAKTILPKLKSMGSMR